MLYEHIVSDIKNINEKGRNPKARKGTITLFFLQQLSVLDVPSFDAGRTRQREVVSVASPTRLGFVPSIEGFIFVWRSQNSDEYCWHQVLNTHHYKS